MERSITPEEKKENHLVDMFQARLRKEGFSLETLHRAIGAGKRLTDCFMADINRFGVAKLVDTETLSPLAVVPLPAVRRFVAKDHFKVGVTDGVHLEYVCELFRERFLRGTGKVEVDVLATSVRVHETRAAPDAGWVADLGGEHMCETALAHLWMILKRQGLGEEGMLNTKAIGNIVEGVVSHYNAFYIRDDSDVLWRVTCRWLKSGGWIIEEMFQYPAKGQGGWVGARIFSS